MRMRISLYTFLFVTFAAANASAFCGFFVGDSTDLYNDATQVMLMRSGQHTAVTMKPTYEGPVSPAFRAHVQEPGDLDRHGIRVAHSHQVRPLSSGRNAPEQQEHPRTWRQTPAVAR